MLVKCYAIVCDTLPTLNQGIELPVFPAKMRPLANAVLQLSHGRTRWASSKLALGERVLISCDRNPANTRIDPMLF